MSLKLKKNLKKHQSDLVCWEMGNCIHNHVLKANKEAMNYNAYVAFNTNKVMNMDNQSWILVHGYVLKIDVNFQFFQDYGKDY